jgi:hypothetical protein
MIKFRRHPDSFLNQLKDIPGFKSYSARWVIPENGKPERQYHVLTTLPTAQVLPAVEKVLPGSKITGRRTVTSLLGLERPRIYRHKDNLDP